MKKILLIIGLLIVLFGGIFIYQRVQVRENTDKLKEYQQQLVARYGENDCLENEDQRKEVLDELENYIQQNQKKLQILSYGRTSTSITVRFFGLNLVLQPAVKGFD